MAIAFRVIGVAQQMGSKRAFVPKGWMRPIITDSNRNLKAWQSLIAEAAGRAIQARVDPWRLLEGPVRLSIAFYLPRPQSLPRKCVAHTKAPDCSKLVRGAEDALSGIVYADDRQVVEIVAGKFYAAVGDPPHCDVRVEVTAGDRPTAVAPAPLPLFADSGRASSSPC